MRLLLVEDDDILGDGLRTVLSQEGYTVDWVQDGQGADLALKSTVYDFVVLDLNLPRRSGLDVLVSLRGREDSVPVIIITARDQLEDRVQALDSGADDYVVKPFDTEELCARLRALGRRSSGRATPLLQHGELVVDPAAHTVTLANTTVDLSPREFAVLQILLENRAKVLSRARLEEALYGWGYEVESNAVEVHIHHLRKKLGSDLIQTVRSVGYTIQNPE